MVLSTSRMPGVTRNTPNARSRGSVRKRGGSYQVRVYAGEDPVTGRPNYLTGSTSDEKEADRMLRRLLTERAAAGSALQPGLDQPSIQSHVRQARHRQPSACPAPLLRDRTTRGRRRPENSRRTAWACRRRLDDTTGLRRLGRRVRPQSCRDPWRSDEATSTTHGN